MYLGRLFGTDGVRGRANEELTCELAFALGQAGAHVLTAQARKQRPDKIVRILVGRDTRRSGEMLENALISGILSTGAQATSVGVVPSPAVAYLTRHYGCDAGVVISASHNPMEDNGVKFFTADGYKLPDEMEDDIEALLGDRKQIPLPTGEQVGHIVHVYDSKPQYIHFLTKSTSARFKGLKVALDCANGASFDVAPMVFTGLGAEVYPFFNQPDGANINLQCGSTYPERIGELVRALNADVGLAFDGDADRLIAVDEKGTVVDGDRIIWACAKRLKARGELVGDTIVGTVMTNMGMEVLCKANGLKLERTQVGDRYVLESMLKNGYVLGGEQSGHVIFRQHTTTGDGMLTAVQLLTAMVEAGKPLSELVGDFCEYPQVTIGVRVPSSQKMAFETDANVQAAIQAASALLKDTGRVLVRASGTEPKVRVMVEGENEQLIKLQAEQIVDAIEGLYRGFEG